MNLYQIKLLLALSLLLSFISCSKDDLPNENITNSDSIEAFGGGDRTDGNRPQGNNQIGRQDHTVVTEWIDLFLELDRYAYGMRPNATARALAYIHLAAYEVAVPGMNNFMSNTEKLPDFSLEDSVIPRNINYELALNTAYADVINHFLLHLPDDKRTLIESMEISLAAIYSANQRDDNTEESIAWGASIAQQIIAYSQSDFEAEEQILEPQPLSYNPPTGEGYWTYSADQERGLFPYWKSVRTFVISGAETTTVPPMNYSHELNSPYYTQMKAVYEANNTARDEDGEQLWIAEFWSDDVTGITFSPPARQFSIANQLIKQRELNLEQALHLNLKLGFSMNDAAVSTWEDKYEYMVMRPNVFIHEFIDPTFQTNLYRLIPWPNPTFPGYPSGHSCFASAAAGVFIDFFGYRTRFTDRSHEGRTEFRGAARSFNNFREMAEENAFSRIPLGVHIEMDCTEGLRLGYEISDAVNGYDVRRRGV